ncbi:hypothetical protein CJF31_00001411 [Rutstroemia sp. NJR-2017a BVV2]|nr:hypothetical protein CJF31_00001411 [Rutstroemia sp. NJR-2017a BVV2]
MQIVSGCPPSSKYRGTVTTDLCTKYTKTLEEILHENNIVNTAMTDIDVGDRSGDRNDRVEMKINKAPTRKIDFDNRWVDSLAYIVGYVHLSSPRA